MATPTLRALREHFGAKARLIGVMRPYVIDVLSGTSWLDDVIAWDRHAKNTDLGTRSVVRRLQRERLDSTLLLTNSFRTALVAWWSGAPQRIGYVRYGRGPILTERLHPPRRGWQLLPISAVDYYLQLAALLGARTSLRRLELATTAGDERAVDALWQRCNLTPDDTVIGLNTGGAYGAAKDWPAEHFAELAARLTAQLPARVVVICGPAERATAQRIVDLADSARVTTIADQPVSIGLSKAIIKRCQLLVTTDSGPRHFGAAFSVPTVTLFGPTDPRWSHNYHPQAVDLQLHVPCGPCAQRICPLGHHRCMQDLNVEHVLRAAIGLLPPHIVPQAA
jgi:heptosyltransferase-2